MKRIVFLSFGILFTLLFIRINTFACGCPARSEDVAKAVNDEFNKSSLVFSGKVVEAKWILLAEKNASDKKIKAEVLVIKFAVNDWWKGKRKNQVIWRTSSVRFPEMNSGMSGSNCEFGFELGRKYLVYASRHNGKLTASVCGGTTRIEKAERDIKQLRKLKEFKTKNLPE